MKEPQIIHQTWPFTCLTCRHGWESAYEAWHTDDGRGGEVTTWRHKGVPSTPPWVEPVCPACSGLDVKTFPPCMRAPAGPRPPAARPPAEAVRPAESFVPRKEPAARASSSGRRPAPAGERLAADPAVPPQGRRR